MLNYQVSLEIQDPLMVFFFAPGLISEAALSSKVKHA